MAMLERTTKQKTLINTMMLTLVVGALLYFAVSINQASSLSNSTGSKTVKMFGINMYEIYKNAVANGQYNAGININYNGILLYFALVILVGLLIGSLRTKLSKH